MTNTTIIMLLMSWVSFWVAFLIVLHYINTSVCSTVPWRQTPIFQLGFDNKDCY